MRVHTWKTTITTSTGSGSATSSEFIGGIVHKILVIPATATTDFEATLTDASNIEARRWDYSFKIDDENPLIVEGKYTLTITNASADEDFTVKMSMEE